MQIDTLLKLYLTEQIEIARNFPIGDMVGLMTAMENTYKFNGSVFIFGNGGGASTAEHFASDLKIHPFVSEDKSTPLDIRRLRVHCLNESNGVITRVSNDIGFDDIFTEQLKSYPLEPWDLVIALSGSGNSPNIIKAIQRANAYGATTALIGGRNGGKAGEIVDICILIPGTSNFPGQVGANDNCFHIEDFQSVVAHMVTGILKEIINEGN